MTSTKMISRRQALKGSLALPLVSGMASLAAGTGTAASATGSASTLVAYFTRTGNTRLIATQIARAQNAMLFQIVPTDPYPEDYEQQVAQAEDERRRGYLPPLQGTVPDFNAFDTVYLGFPIWGTTAPAVIRSFLSTHDMSGRTLAPFVTHGGYGLGNSLTVVAEHAPGARLLDAFSKACDQERQTLRDVMQWLQTTETAR